jgi:murein DD-endopeptidase MepM/ murein hydrolase activator NlpD
MRQMTRPHIGRLSVTRRARLVAVGCLVALLAGMFAAPVSAGDPLADAIAKQKALHTKIAAQKVQIAKLRTLQSNLQGDIRATSTALDAVNADVTTVKKQVAKTTTLVNDARDRAQGLAAQIRDWDDTVATLQAGIDKDERLLNIRKDLLATRLRAAYVTSRTSLLETVLSAQSFTDVMSDVSSYVDISAQDQALATQIDHERQLLEIEKQSSLDARATADELRVEARDQKTALVGQLEELRKSRDKLKKLEAAKAHQLSLQQRNFTRARLTASQLKAAMNREIAAENALKNKIAQLIASQGLGGNIPSQYNGSLMWPLGGTVSQEFGCTGVDWEPPLGNCAHYHNGIDIAAPMGTPIRASGDGVVVFAGYNPYDPYPKAVIVIVAHSTSLQTWYAHLEPGPPVHPGEKVSQGQVIGYVGMTGRTSGPHLHWMVELDQSFRSPRLFL